MFSSLITFAILIITGILIVGWIIWSFLALTFLIKYHGSMPSTWVVVAGYLVITIPFFVVAAQSYLGFLTTFRSLTTSLL